MLARSLSQRSGPHRIHGEDPGQSVEASLVRDESAVRRLPPVALKKARHDSVATATVPNEHSARSEDAGEFGEDATIIRRLGKEAKRREEIEHGVEATTPSRGQRSHVAAGVSKTRSCSAATCAGQ